MTEFIEQYLGSVLVGAVVFAAVALIIIGMIGNKRAGKRSRSCGGDCAACVQYVQNTKFPTQKHSEHG